MEEAIALYRQIIDDSPRDWEAIEAVGDLYARLNKAKDASNECAKVASFYAKDGSLMKAIAIWMKLQRLDQMALDPYLTMADLYAEQGLMTEAKGQYQSVVDEYIKRGKVREAGEILKKMVDIDPADLKIRSKLTDLHCREGELAEEIGEHISIARSLISRWMAGARGDLLAAPRRLSTARQPALNEPDTPVVRSWVAAVALCRESSRTITGQPSGPLVRAGGRRRNAGFDDGREVGHPSPSKGHSCTGLVAPRAPRCDA